MSGEQISLTARPTVAALEERIGKPVQVLDHGFVRVIDYMGDDSAVVQAARVSYGRGTRKVSEDRGLIRYLMRHRHTTPFEMCVLKLHVKLPIFIARQWIRHRMASINEISARYSILDNEFYIPAIEQICEQSSENKQGRGDTIDADYAKLIVDLLRSDAARCYSHYNIFLNDPASVDYQDGVPSLSRELARINLTLNTYTEFYWKADLHNLLHFLSLRADSHAQYEIRAYAEIIMQIVAAWVPLTYEAFCDYRLGAVTFSKQQMQWLREAIDNVRKLDEMPDKPASLTGREWDEMRAALAPSEEP